MRQSCHFWYPFCELRVLSCRALDALRGHPSLHVALADHESRRLADHHNGHNISQRHAAHHDSLRKSSFLLATDSCSPKTPSPSLKAAQRGPNFSINTACALSSKRGLAEQEPRLGVTATATVTARGPTEDEDLACFT